MALTYLTAFIAPLFVRMCYESAHYNPGMLGTINQIATSVGVLIVYALPFVLDYRWLAIFGGFNAAATMILMVFMPETPRCSLFHCLECTV